MVQRAGAAVRFGNPVHLSARRLQAFEAGLDPPIDRIVQHGDLHRAAPARGVQQRLGQVGIGQPRHGGHDTAPRGVQFAGNHRPDVAETGLDVHVA